MSKYEHTLTALFRKWNVDGAYVAGDEYWCCCPFHGEKRAAFSVNLETGKWNCLACHKRGTSMTQLVAALEGVTEAKAEDVLERFGIDTIAALKTELRELLRSKLTRHTDKKGNDTLYTTEWKRHAGQVAPYLTKRGFTEEVLHDHNIGYDKVNKLVILPVFEQSTCRFVYKRITWKKANKKLPSYKYPHGVDKSFYLWGMDRRPEFYEDEQIILCEGSLDALWFRQHGFPHAFAILGSFISWDQIRRIEDMQPREVIMAFDNDKAGLDCTVSASKMLLKTGFGKCYYAPYARGVGDPQSATPEQVKRMIDRKKSVRPLVWGSEPSSRMKQLLAV